MQTVDRLRARVVAAGSAAALELDTPAGLRTYVSPESAFEMYERVAAGDVRALRIRRDTNGTTRIVGATTGTLGLGDVTMLRAEILTADGTVENKTRLTTTQPDGFEFVDRVTFGGGVSFGDGDAIHQGPTGDTFVPTLQIWKRIEPADPDAAHVHGATNLLAYQWVINDFGELTLIKHSAFNGATPDAESTLVSKVVAVFGQRMLLPSDESTAPSEVMVGFVAPIDATGGTGTGTGTGAGTGTDTPDGEPAAAFWFRSVDVDDALYSLDRVGVGTAAPQHALHVAGDPAIDRVFSELPIHTTSNLVCHTMMTESDARVKTDVASMDLSDAARAVAQLRPCSYRRTDAPHGAAPTQGFIAQEVREAVPAAVTVAKSNAHALPDFHFVDPVPLIANLVAAVQDLTRRVDELSSAQH